MADKKISQLDLAAQINNDAVIPMSQENGGEETTYKALITALGAKIAEGLTFSNLATTAKNLVGAINELQAGGGGGGAAILIGITTPSSSQGSNGNLYIKYTEGVGGADDTVDAIYVKLDGTWCEVTTDYADLLNKPSINNNTLSGNKTNSDLGIYGKTIEMSSTDPDFVADRITALETSVSGKVDTTYLNGLLKVTRETTSYTVAANAGVGLTYSFITTPTGYAFCGIVGYSTNNRNVVPYAIGMTASGDSKFALRNLSGSSITDNLDVYVLWAKTGTVI